MDCVKCKKPLPENAVFCPSCGRKQTREKKKRTRANGQGSVYRLPNGKYRAEKVIGWKLIPPPEGAPEGTPPKKQKITVTDSTFLTKSAALDALPTLTAKKENPRSGINASKNIGDQITLKALYDKWLPTHTAGKSTLNCYKAGFKLFAPLWYTPMSDIEIDDLQECLDDATQGKKTKCNARTALGLVYKYGIPRNHIQKDRNLAHFLVINEEDGIGGEGFSRDELALIRDAAAAGNRDAQYVYCHCLLGFRPTGFLNLKTADYNASERAFRGGIKTEAGKNRIVTVAPKIQGYVDLFLSECKEGYVFGRDGERMGLKAYRETFYALLDSLGIDNPINEEGRHRLTPHSCRHTFATLMKRTVGSDKDKLSLIGHTSTEQLRDYQDVDYEDLRAITDQF